MEEKGAIVDENLKKVTIPSTYNEYAVKNVWGKVCHSSTLCYYLPSDEMHLGRYPDREYFWNVLNTIHP